MKLLGTVLGFDLGGEGDLGSRMETETAASSTKKETSASKPTGTSKPAPAELTPVRKFIFNNMVMFVHCM